jgi:AcrR family transcriptional regulator
MSSSEPSGAARRASGRRAPRDAGAPRPGAHVRPRDAAADASGHDKLTGLRKRPRQSRAQATFDAVLDAAAELIAQRGYAGTTTNAVAKRAGISIGSLYQYFPNKTAILVSLLERHIYEVQPVVVEGLAALGDPAAPFEDTLRQLLLRLIDAHGRNPRLMEVLSEEAPHPPSIQRLRRKLEGGYVAQMAEILRRRPDVRVPDPDVAAQVIAVVTEAATYWLSHSMPRNADKRRHVDEVVRLVSAYTRQA